MMQTKHKTTAQKTTDNTEKQNYPGSVTWPGKGMGLFYVPETTLKGSTMTNRPRHISVLHRTVIVSKSA